MSLHPVVEAMMQAMEEARIPAFSDGTPVEARTTMEAMRNSGPPREVPRLADIRDIEISGAQAVPARVYIPEGKIVGTIVYMHGGGWVIGDLETSHPPAATLAAASQCQVVSIDYRLAPEHPFPAALDDVMQALGWAAEKKAPLFVAGDSAGGNLAAAATLRARAEGGPPIMGQILIYPALDASLDTASHRKNSPLNYILTSRDMAWFWNHYAGAAAHKNQLVAPALADDLIGLPAAFIAVASHDVLRDEGIAYAQRLKSAGVETKLQLYEGMVHGFVGFLGLVDTADRALSEMGAWAHALARQATGR